MRPDVRLAAARAVARRNGELVQMAPPKGEIVDTAASGLPPAATAALASRSRTERATS